MLPQGCFVRASTGITMFSTYVEEYEPLGDNTGLVKELALYGEKLVEHRKEVLPFSLTSIYVSAPKSLSVSFLCICPTM